MGLQSNAGPGRLSSSAHSVIMWPALIFLILAFSSGALSQSRTRFSRYRSWNSQMYPVWRDGDPRYRDCWKGGEVAFDVRSDSPTLTGAKASFNIDVRFPQNQTVLPDGQVVWARNCTVNGTSYTMGQDVYPESSIPREWSGLFPDRTPFNRTGNKKPRFIYVWKTLGKYWQVADGPSSLLSIETDNVPLGSYSMEVVIYHCRGKDKFIPLGYASTQFSITDQLSFAVTLAQVGDINQGDQSFIQNRAVSFSIDLHDPSSYLSASDITFNWDFGDNSGTLISHESTVTHTYLTPGSFRPQVVLMAAIPTGCVSNPTAAATVDPPVPVTDEATAVETMVLTAAPQPVEVIPNAEEGVSADVPVVANDLAVAATDAVNTADAVDTADAADTINTVDSADTVTTVDAADTVDTVDAANTVDTVDTAETDTVDAANTVETVDTVTTVDAADTVDTVDAANTVDTVDTAETDTVDAANTVETVDTVNTVDAAAADPALAEVDDNAAVVVATPAANEAELVTELPVAEAEITAADTLDAAVEAQPATQLPVAEAENTATDTLNAAVEVESATQLPLAEAENTAVDASDAPAAVEAETATEVVADINLAVTVLPEAPAAFVDTASVQTVVETANDIAASILPAAEDTVNAVAEATEAIAGVAVSEAAVNELEAELVAGTEAAQVALVIAKRQAPEMPTQTNCMVYRYGSFATTLTVVQPIESVEIVEVNNVVVLATEVEQNAVDLTITCQGSLPNEVCTVVSDADCVNPVQSQCNTVTPSPECQLILRQVFNNSGTFCINVSLTNDVSLAVTSARLNVAIDQNSSRGMAGATLGVLFLVCALAAVAFTYKRFKDYHPLREDDTSSSFGSGRSSVPSVLWNLLNRRSTAESRPLLLGRVV